MSTTIDVYPSSARVPTFSELADTVQQVLVSQRSDRYFTQHVGDISDDEMRPSIERVVESSDRSVMQRFDAETELLSFRGEDYGWASFAAVKSGFDFYFDDEPDPLDEWSHADVIAEYAERAEAIGTLQGFPFDRAAEVEWRWYLRMQATQPLHTRLLSGYVAVALARLTNGFIHSDDGGVDYDRAPTDPETFLTSYPEWITREILGTPTS
ncbi:hypothetical protein MZK47_00010 [Microbacterium aerolatum]|uniref:hypothetical protein n=1 Tax=Microbacterium aerolatum TaxID=153731 RepID=UPI0020008293|nr:hypothetical protein [Microbacterium aerolatum]MCK3768060.1 hypothetical protein [Microbacterium aerolatum]